MTNHVTTRGLAAAAALVATLIGGSSEALGQQATLAVPAAPAIATVATPAPALPVATPAPVAPAAPVTLDQLVEQFAGGPALDEQANCIATAVYFESMGEPLKGQLAVARVVINRAASGRYPTTYCGVVKQKAQFSFVRGGRFPRIDPDCPSWRKAKAITRIAMENAAPSLSPDVLWYHANYVAPKWRNNLTKYTRIGAHIFYRS